MTWKDDLPPRQKDLLIACHPLNEDRKRLPPARRLADLAFHLSQLLDEYVNDLDKATSRYTIAERDLPFIFQLTLSLASLQSLDNVEPLLQYALKHLHVAWPTNVSREELVTWLTHNGIQPLDLTSPPPRCIL